MANGGQVVNIPVTLVDGPCGGRVIRYGNPLPETLVVADKTNGVSWHDYTRTVVAQRYRHSDRCKCLHREAPPINLDAII